MNQPDYIAGVYNYCDRWCERCFLTSRCRVYEDSGKSSGGETELQNKAFWEELSGIFAKTIQLLHKAAAERGIDLSNSAGDATGSHERRWSLTRKKAEVPPLSQLSLHYIKEGRKWLDEKEHFDQLAADYVLQFKLGLKSEKEIAAAMATVKDCMEVVQWYLHFIHVKFSRALSGRENGESWQEEHGFQNDSDGSAKIALIATERSLAAWIKLYELLPGEQEQILALLAILQKMKKLGEEEFPGVKTFVRPGFDE